jgi:HD superfamily phosphohydrolase
LPSDKKLFRDPIHGFIEVSGVALKIIDTPYFQRLRRIKQLGLTDYVFHGAEHSRFGHSLGVYHLARQLSERLFEKNHDTLRDEFCLAALLHDIGHHPLSHCFESVLENKFGHDFKHEKYTVSILENTIVGEYIAREGLSVRNVINLIEGKYVDNAEFTHLNYLISSELDLDRLDYLQRDAYYCGVPYGKIDVDRIILNLESENGEIAINEKAMAAVEMYIMARFYMYTQVYMHHTRKAFDIMLANAFSESSLDGLNYPEPKKDDIERFIWYDDSWLRSRIEYLSHNSKGIESILSSGILNRDPIRWVIEKSTYAEVKDIETEAKRFYADTDFLNIANLEQEKEDIAKLAGIECEEIFFDTPLQNILFSSRYTPYSPSDYKAIKIKSAGETTEIASNPSSLAYYIARCSAQICRVYTLQEHRERVAQVISNKHPDLKRYTWRKPE